MNSFVVMHLFALFAIISVAAVYEVFEWQYVIFGDPVAGAEVLGSQGDVWDARKDIVADTLGAIVILVFYHLVRGRREPDLVRVRKT